MSLYDREGTFLQSGGAGVNRRDHLQFTTDGPELYFLRFDNAPAGSRYQLQLNPADLITTNPPQSLGQACLKAEAKLAKAKEKLAAAKANFASKRKVKKLKKKVKKAKRQVKKACG